MSMAAVCLLCCPAVGADDFRVTVEPRPGSRTPGKTDFRAETNLVLIPVSVTDAKNHSVIGLGRDAFRIFEDKAEQKLTQFATGDVPLSVGIVFDASGSMQDKMAESREAVRQFLRTANPEDEFFLVEFSSHARITVPFTTDAGQVEERLQRTEPRGRTALLDAVCLAMDQMKKARNPRHALLVISDGGDNDSRFTQYEMRRRVRESDLWIYSIGIYGHHTAMLPEESQPGQSLLSALAEESGGRHAAVEYLRDLPEIAASIGRELRDQYILGYRPAGDRRDGKYHRVQVKLVERRDLTIASRPGYFGAME
jgi:Ca-activated chloride channel homolog